MHTQKQGQITITLNPCLLRSKSPPCLKRVEEFVNGGELTRMGTQVNVKAGESISYVKKKIDGEDRIGQMTRARLAD